MAERLPVSLAALYAKVKRTGPGCCVPWCKAVLSPGSAGGLPAERQGLPGWQLRVFDGNHQPASEKRLAPLRGFEAALSGHTLVVYDPGR